MNLQLTSLDILYLSLSIGFLVFVGLFGYLTAKISTTLTALNYLIDDLDDTASDIRGVKNYIKRGVFSTVSVLLGTIIGRGGEKNYGK